MSKKIYVGNLAFSTNAAELRALFAEHGEVTDAVVIEDRETGRSRGFGFVEMATAEATQKAISALNGRTVDGRQLNVNIAKERTR
jgi:cold-inducible RNA-binding protein